MDSYFLYVYSNGQTLRCLTLDEELRKGKDLRELGWVNTVTINPQRFIEGLPTLNDAELVEAIRELRTG